MGSSITDFVNIHTVKGYALISGIYSLILSCLLFGGVMSKSSRSCLLRLAFYAMVLDFVTRLILFVVGMLVLKDLSHVHVDHGAEPGVHHSAGAVEGHVALNLLIASSIIVAILEIHFIGVVNSYSDSGRLS